VRFAYADPPYLGCGKIYAKLHPDALAWDDPEEHRRLIARLVDEFPEGWAMSLTSGSLQTLLPMCPAGVRIGAWTKPFASFKPNVTPAYAWEPVVFSGGRRRGRKEWSGRDWVQASPPVFTQRAVKSTPGQKPLEFCF
jgi:hypothetical protein